MLVYAWQELSQMAMFQMQTLFNTLGFGMFVGTIISLCIGVPILLSKPWRD